MSTTMYSDMNAPMTKRMKEFEEVMIARSRPVDTRNSDGNLHYTYKTLDARKPQD